MSKYRKTLITLALILGASLLAFGIAPVHAEDGEPMPISDTEGTAVESDEGDTPTESDSDSATTESDDDSSLFANAPSITMLPTTEYVSLQADTPVEKTLVISNDSAVSYRFRLYAQPYTIDDSGDNYTFAFNTMNSYTAIYKWITFADASGNYVDDATYSIEPGESKTITYRIDPPSAIPAGGQYAAIFAETINEEAATGNINGIYTVSRVALLLYGRSNEGILIDSEITDYQVESFLLGGPITATAKVKSKGNIDVTATYKMIVRGIFGNELYANTWAYPVLPDTERYVAMTWEDTPAFGIYQVQFAVSTIDHEEDRTTVVLIYPVYMIIITILVLTIIIVWIIIMLKKRKERKSRLIV